MAYDPSGIYSLPPVYRAEPGTTIQAGQHNAPLEDIARALSSVMVRDGRAGMTNDLPMGNNAITGMAARSDPSSAATVGQLTPIGTVIDFAGSNAPSGWLFCGGQEVSRTDFADLFAVIGTTYGNGNGSTTFNVPDLRGLVVAGRNNMAGQSSGRLTNSVFGANVHSLGSIGGSQDHTLTTAQMPTHNHTGSTNTAGNHSHSVGANYIGSGDSSNGGYIRSSGTGATTSTAGNHSHSLNINNRGGGGAHPNVQPTMVLNKIVRASY